MPIPTHLREPTELGSRGEAERCDKRHRRVGRDNSRSRSRCCRIASPPTA